MGRLKLQSFPWNQAEGGSSTEHTLAELLLPPCLASLIPSVPRPALSHLGYCLVTHSCLTFVTSWTVACQTPLSMGFSRQEHWSGLPFPAPRNLPNPGIEPASPGRWILYHLNHQGSPQTLLNLCLKLCFWGTTGKAESPG